MKNINGWFLLDNEQDMPMVESAQRAPNDCNYKDWHTNFIDDILELYAPDMERRVALDIGGCVGMMAVPFAQQYEQVHTFEINPQIRECLKLNTEKYPNVTVHDYGLSDKEGPVRFSVLPWSGGSRVSPNGEQVFEVKTLDSFEFENVDLIKMDVEGHEYQAMIGASETVRRCKPLIITEIHSRRDRRSYQYRQALFAHMKMLDYELIDVRQADYIWRHK